MNTKQTLEKVLSAYWRKNAYLVEYLKKELDYAYMELEIAEYEYNNGIDKDGLRIIVAKENLRSVKKKIIDNYRYTLHD